MRLCKNDRWDKGLKISLFIYVVSTVLIDRLYTALPIGFIYDTNPWLIPYAWAFYILDMPIYLAACYGVYMLLKEAGILK